MHWFFKSINCAEGKRLENRWPGTFGKRMNFKSFIWKESERLGMASRDLESADGGLEAGPPRRRKLHTVQNTGVPYTIKCIKKTGFCLKYRLTSLPPASILKAVEKVPAR